MNETTSVLDGESESHDCFDPKWTKSHQFLMGSLNLTIVLTRNERNHVSFGRGVWISQLFWPEMNETIWFLTGNEQNNISYGWGVWISWLFWPKMNETIWFLTGNEWNNISYGQVVWIPWSILKPKERDGRDGGDGQSSESWSDDYVGPSFWVNGVAGENGHATVSHKNHHQMTAACMEDPVTCICMSHVPVPQLHMTFVIDNWW